MFSTNINFNKTLTLLAGFGLLAVSCQEKNPVVEEPVFPTAVVRETLNAGESKEISFDANLDWEVSASGEGLMTYFWIDDAGIKAEKVKGSKGVQTVKVVFAADEEIEIDRVCTLTLSMSGKSAIIAEITRKGLGREFNVYPVLYDGGFVKDDNGEYVLDTTPAESLALVRDGSQFYTYAAVVSNIDWVVSLPDWVASEPATGAAGKNVVKLSADPSRLDNSFISGKEGSLVFFDAADEEYSRNIAVTFPAIGSYVEQESNSSLIFNKEGQLKMPSGSFGDTPSIHYAVGTRGFVVRALEFTSEGWHALEYASWVKASVTYKNESDLIANATIEITVDANEGAPRCADIFLFPVELADVAADAICDENSSECAFKAAYAPYCIGRLEQGGVEPDYISFSADEEPYMATLARQTESWLFNEFETSQVFTLTYTDKFSESALQFDKAFARYEIYDYDVAIVKDEANFWLTFNPFAMNKKGKVYMEPDKFKNMYAEATESFIVFYDDKDAILAVLDCLYDGSSQGGGEQGIISVTSNNASVETLDASSEIYQALSAEYSTDKVYKVTTSDYKLTLHSELPFSNLLLRSGVPPFGQITDGSFEAEAWTANDIMVWVGESVSEYSAAILILKDANKVNFAVVYLEFDPSAAGATAPFRFAYPDYVSGATLSQYTGSMLSAIKGEFYGIDERNIYELKYTAANPSMAMIETPGIPSGEAAWNNWDDAKGGPSADYWLGFEMMSSTQMLVFMSEAGKTDYFVWKDNMGMFKYVLICTLELK